MTGNKNPPIKQADFFMLNVFTFVEKKVIIK